MAIDKQYGLDYGEYTFYAAYKWIISRGFYDCGRTSKWAHLAHRARNTRLCLPFDAAAADRPLLIDVALAEYLTYETKLTKPELHRGDADMKLVKSLWRGMTSGWNSTPKPPRLVPPLVDSREKDGRVVDILQLIHKEHKRHRVKYSVEDDGDHDVCSWAELIIDHTDNVTEANFKTTMLKVAAICVSAIEWDGRTRKQGDLFDAPTPKNVESVALLHDGLMEFVSPSMQRSKPHMGDIDKLSTTVDITDDPHTPIKPAKLVAGVMELATIRHGFDNYQRMALRTAEYPACYVEDGHNQVNKAAWIYPAMKLGGELGEVQEKFGKTIRDSRGIITVEFREDMTKELGDILWYVSAIAAELEIDLGWVANDNIKKLYDRKNRGVIKGSGDDR